MINKSLFDIQGEYLEIIEHLEDNGGEITDEMFERLNINKDELTEKMKGYNFVIKGYKGEVDVLKDEIKRLQAKKTAKENTVIKLKEIMLTATKLYGNESKPNNEGYTNHSLDMGTFKLFTKNITSVFIDSKLSAVDESVKRYNLGMNVNKETLDKISKLIPGYTEEQTSVVFDKKEIERRLKAKEDIKGVSLSIKESSITIR